MPFQILFHTVHFIDKTLIQDKPKHIFEVLWEDFCSGKYKEVPIKRHLPPLQNLVTKFC